jgi:hypothetical protein
VINYFETFGEYEELRVGSARLCSPAYIIGGRLNAHSSQKQRRVGHPEKIRA